MANFKKIQQIRRGSLCNLFIGFFLISLSYVLLQSFLYAFILLGIFVTLSTINVLYSYGKPLWKFSSDHRSFEVGDSACSYGLKSALALPFGVIVYYFFAILFGAPVFESYKGTLFFSCLMVLLTVYPYSLYFCFSDPNSQSSESKYDSIIENHFLRTVMWSIVGAWFGAFPIPLDWDRPWQIWPQTCCIGAILGYASALFFDGGVTLWNSYMEKKINPKDKMSWKIFA